MHRIVEQGHRCAMAATITWDHLRELAGFRTENGCAISLYVDLDPAVSPTPQALDTRVNSLLDRGDAADGSSREHRKALRADVQRIRSWLDAEFDRDGARGLALFCSGTDNLWQPMPLADAVQDDLRLGRELYVAPLVRLVSGSEGALVGVVGRERGDLYRLTAGRLAEVAEQYDDTPGRHDQGGWSQARYGRHIEDLVHKHLKAWGELLDRRVRAAKGNARVVLVCSEDMRSEALDVLAPETRASVVGWTTAEAHAGPPELLAAVTPLLDEARAERERRALERWQEEAGRDGRAASGWRQVLEAASDGRVECLLFDERAAPEAYQCPRCGRGSFDGGSCPLDGTELDRHEDALDLAVHQVLAHGGSVLAVREAPNLGPVEGIAALLRF
jgi:peptide chain release factor subunit 1